MTKLDQVTHEAMRTVNAEMAFIAGDNTVIHSKPKKVGEPKRRKMSTFPSGSNSPLWFFGFR